MPIPWSPNQVRVRCKLSIQRIRTNIEKNEAQAKRARRDVSSLLEMGKIETAKIRTEALILQDTHNELLELLELYLELILARFGLLEGPSTAKEPDEGVREAVCSVVYAAPRTEIRELHVIREAFMQRFGRDWAISVMDHSSNVSRRVLGKCSSATPDQAWVDMYLYEIAKAYQVSWKPEGLIDLDSGSIDQADSETDTAAHTGRARAVTAEFTASPPDYDESKSGRGDSNGGVALPTAPNDAPRLGDVRSSTSHIPIVRALTPGSGDPMASGSRKSFVPSSGTTETPPTSILPAPPPTHPNQSDHTIVIKTNMPRASESTATKTVPPGDAEDSRFDSLAARFAALKRK